MADLKRLDVDTLTRGIREQADARRREISAAEEAALLAVEEAARALAALPKTSSDLVESAEAFLVREIDLTDFGSSTYVRVSIGGMADPA